jgi:hypothetical protein
MMGIPLEGPANVFCDNMAVVINASVPTSTLKKKNVSIAYNMVRESCVMGMIRIAHERTETNLADCLTKCLPAARVIDLITRYRTSHASGWRPSVSSFLCFIL